MIVHRRMSLHGINDQKSLDEVYKLLAVSSLLMKLSHFLYFDIKFGFFEVKLGPIIDLIGVCEGDSREKDHAHVEEVYFMLIVSIQQSQVVFVNVFFLLRSYCNYQGTYEDVVVVRSPEKRHISVLVRRGKKCKELDLVLLVQNDIGRADVAHPLGLYLEKGTHFQHYIHQVPYFGLFKVFPCAFSTSNHLFQSIIEHFVLKLSIS